MQVFRGMCASAQRCDLQGGVYFRFVHLKPRVPRNLVGIPVRFVHLKPRVPRDLVGINLLEYYCPSLMAKSGFISFFISPCVVGSKLKETLSFSNLPECRIWCERNCGGCG